jgi:MFS transporter, ACS family, tartrate transporter
VPSNVILHKVGARVWIARIMITWGIVASATAFVQGEVSFYIVRFLLGVAEAGFFPGIILYLTYWFPRAQRAKMVSLFYLAVPLASTIGSPISSLLIANGEGALGFDAGWRFMFFAEGLPSILIGVVVLFMLVDKPAKARWLSAEESAALEKAIAEEDGTRGDHGIRRALTDGRVLTLALVYFGIVFGSYTLQFFLPLVVAGLKENFTVVQIGFITAVPYAVALVALLLNARHSDRTGERELHVAVPAFIGAAGVSVALFFDSPVLVIAAMSICAAGVYAAVPVFWQLPSKFLSGVGAAAGIALINSFGNIGGFAGPYMTGWLKDITGNHKAGMFVVAAFMIMSAVVVIVLGRRLGERASVTE